MRGRRDCIGAIGAAIGVAAGAAPVSAQSAWAGLPAEFARIERREGGRLGVAVLDLGHRRAAEHRSGDRFPMASTFKMLAAGAVLARIDAGQDSLDRRIRFGRGDLVTYSPVTEGQVGGEGMTVAALLEAMMTLSDNTAANLLLTAIGGPEGLTAFLRRHGDAVTRLDRMETALNEARPGDPRDTTSPAAMLATMRALTLGEVLSAASRARLVALMEGNRVSGGLFRARLPQGWRIGDRSGAGGFNTRGIAAVIWPSGGQAPLLVTAYLAEGPQQTLAARDAVLAEVAAAIFTAYGAG
ncbi:class A beta-lactamase [Roseomonas sp. JC162]|uniref:Beta-lactamase n=1 Tax=Neoroseomonas marina TaxID=1232220 RepID=A0A848E682_9PROT|nr:class A beta-lactamase [Neoroseomonas marina]NMJ39626.1 class A beta-lactamase [Neoroseomonas marina]